MTPSEAILALTDAGCTESAIAQAAGTSQPTINRIKHGADPGYELGNRIVRLRAKEVLRLQRVKAAA